MKYVVLKLDDEMHRQLKVKAAVKGATIVGLVKSALARELGSDYAGTAIRA